MSEKVMNATSRAMPVLFAFLCTKTIVLGTQFDRVVPAATAAVLLLAVILMSRRMLLG